MIYAVEKKKVFQLTVRIKIGNTAPETELSALAFHSNELL